MIIRRKIEIPRNVTTLEAVWDLRLSPLRTELLLPTARPAEGECRHCVITEPFLVKVMFQPFYFSWKPAITYGCWSSEAARIERHVDTLLLTEAPTSSLFYSFY